MCTLCFVLGSQEQTTVAFKAGQRCIHTGPHTLTVVSPTELEVTIAHTKIFLARGWEIDKTGGARIFIATCHCSSPYELATEQRSTI